MHIKGLLGCCELIQSPPVQHIASHSSSVVSARVAFELGKWQHSVLPSKPKTKLPALLFWGSLPAVGPVGLAGRYFIRPHAGEMKCELIVCA